MASQIRQNNTLGKAKAEREWFSTWHSLVRDSIGSEKAVELFRNGLHNYSGLSQNGQAVFSTRLIAMFDHVDVLRRLHEKNYVADDLLEPLLNVLNATVATPGGRECWEEIGPMLSRHSFFEKHKKESPMPITSLMPYFSEQPRNK